MDSLMFILALLIVFGSSMVSLMFAVAVIAKLLGSPLSIVEIMRRL